MTETFSEGRVLAKQARNAAKLRVGEKTHQLFSKKFESPLNVLEDGTTLVVRSLGTLF